jgi:hypothetical protein
MGRKIRKNESQKKKIKKEANTFGQTNGRMDTERGCRIGLADYRVRTCKGQQRPVLLVN